MRAVAVIAGFIIIAGTLTSAIRTVILPRAASSWLTRSAFRVVRLPFVALAGPRHPYERRDRILALYGPVTLMALPMVWLTMVLVGFMLVMWGLVDQSLGDAFHMAVSSITTLGFAPADTFLERLLAFVASGLGLSLLALLISFLPAIYAAFSRRENPGWSTRGAGRKSSLGSGIPGTSSPDRGTRRLG